MARNIETRRHRNTETVTMFRQIPVLHLQHSARLIAAISACIQIAAIVSWPLLHLQQLLHLQHQVPIAAFASQRDCIAARASIAAFAAPLTSELLMLQI